MLRMLVQLLRLETTAQWLDPLLPAQNLEQVLRKHFAQRFDAQQRQFLASAEPRVFIAVKHHNWEQAGLIDSWADVAETVPWDWASRYDQHASDWHQRQKAAFNDELFERVQAAHKEKPLTHFFSYLSGRWLYPETIWRIGALGIITLNFSFDDSHRFWGKRREGLWTGIASIAPAYDLNITAQHPADLVKYRLAGARALYLPPGGNPKAFANLPKVEKRYFVSFVGQCYGVRKEYIDHLRAHGIAVYTRGGEGWPEGPVSHEEMLTIYAASHIILGFGYTGHSRRKTAVKGRDFEIPLTGTAYLTTRDPVLSQYFREGEEILFYRNPDELVNMLRQYAERTDELARIGQAGQRRALAGHGWSHRWSQALGLLRQGLSL